MCARLKVPGPASSLSKDVPDCYVQVWVSNISGFCKRICLLLFSIYFFPKIRVLGIIRYVCLDTIHEACQTSSPTV